MSLHSDSEGRGEPLGVRRPVELPEVDTETADDLAPASGTRRMTEHDRFASGAAAEVSADSRDADSASGDARKADPRTRPEDASPSGNKEHNLVSAQDIAGVAPSGAGAGKGDGTPSDRPKKPILAAVAIGGAVLLSIPVLLIGAGSYHDKKHRTVAAADTVLPGNGQQPPGAFVSASPSVTPTPSASASVKGKPKTSAKPAQTAARKRPVTVSAKDTFAGASHVLLKNAGTGMCADLPGYGNGSINGPVNQYYCALGDTDNQVWALGVMQGTKGPGGAPLFGIRNVKDNLCMDLPMYGAQPAGTKVSEFACRPTPQDNQLWYYTHSHGSLYRIHNYASHGLCLGVTGRSHASSDSRLEIHGCGSGDDWSWPNGE